MKKYSFIENGLKVFNVKSENRDIISNIIIGLFGLFGVFCLPSIFSSIYIKIGLGSIASNMIGEISFILVLMLLYKEDLKSEIVKFKNNFKSYIKEGFRYYLAGYLCMIFFNLIISMVLKDVSQNEAGVRELLFNLPVYAFINIAIFAPIAEELSFRKTLSPIFKDKYVFALVSGLLFGGAHLMTNILSNTLALTDLLYLLPYGTLGFVFALMDKKTNNTFTSISMHAFHNTITCILLLLLHFLGVN